MNEDATPAELDVDKATQLLDEIEAELAAIGRAIDQITGSERSGPPATPPGS